MSQSSRASRRSLIRSTTAILTVSSLSPAQKGPKIVVVGAGAFGGWTALHLLRRGAQVTLIDAWGPGNSRASSGGETRIIRATYGPDKVYYEMVARSLELWREHERRWNRQLFHAIGCMVLPGDNDAWEKASVPLFREFGLPCEVLSPAQAAKRWPQMRFEGVKWLIFEKEAGYLTARRNCAAVLEAFLQEGGSYRQVEARPGRIQGRTLQSVQMTGGAEIEADQFVFACGPWLGNLFPDVIGDRIQPSRQQVFFLGLPTGVHGFDEENLPAWIDHGTRPFYGIPGNEWRGFKIADDARGPLFDPTTGERTITAEALEEARAYLARRFPGMERAPLVESRVCQYENTPDHHFILDRHPGLENVVLAGGGSGHGYKHGPAFGERIAQVVMGNRQPDSLFRLARLKR